MKQSLELILNTCDGKGSSLFLQLSPVSSFSKILFLTRLKIKALPLMQPGHQNTPAPTKMQCPAWKAALQKCPNLECPAQQDTGQSSFESWLSSGIYQECWSSSLPSPKISHLQLPLEISHPRHSPGAKTQLPNDRAGADRVTKLPHARDVNKYHCPANQMGKSPWSSDDSCFPVHPSLWKVIQLQGSPSKFLTCINLFLPAPTLVPGQSKGSCHINIARVTAFVL